MTKADFGMFVVRPIFAAALVCASPAGNLKITADFPHYVLAVLFLAVPLALLMLGGKKS